MTHSLLRADRRPAWFTVRSGVILALFLAATAHAADPFPAVLTDNAVGDEPAIPTGVTYTAEPAYGNPVDSTGRRLLDTDRPWDDWNTTVGINTPEQTVLFDFKAEYRFSSFSLRMPMAQRPAHVDFSIAAEEEGPWTEVGRLEPVDGEQDEGGWFHFTPEAPACGRYLKLEFTIKEWGWYVKEAKFWGVRGDEPGADVELPLVKEGEKLAIVKDGKPTASIIVAGDASSKRLKSARFLQETVRRMSGATLPLRDDSKDWAGGQILLGPSKLGDVQVEQGLDKPERYRLVVAGRKVHAVGNDAGPYQGSHFATHDLLSQLGCGWFGPDPLYHVVPRAGTLALPSLSKDEQPDFAFRQMWNVSPEAGGAWRTGGREVGCSHAYSYLFPESEYFEKHPEYFALVGGKRTAGGAQICLSNPDVQRLTVEKARAQFDKEPGQLTQSLSANDCGGFCECAACAKLGENPGAQTLAFANAVAKELAKTHPDRLVCFLSYWYTFGAPANLKAEPNVMVMVVNQGCGAHALDDPACPQNQAWCENFEKWCATGAKMAIYEWYIPGTTHKYWRRLPWVSTDVAFRNLRYWRSRGVRWITYESQPAYEDGTGYPRRWPLYYPSTIGMWDCDADPGEILADACNRLYGPAGAVMTRYFTNIAQAIEQAKVHGSTWHMPHAQWIFRPEVTQALRATLGEALMAARPEPEAWRRVVKEAELWSESEATLADLPEIKQHTVDARAYNGGVWFTDKDELTGAFIRDIVGIGANEGLFVVDSDGKRRALTDEETYNTVGGIRIVTKAEQ